MKLKKTYILILIFLFLITVILLIKFWPDEDKFSLIVIPDTQRYSYENHYIFCNQTEWIVENKERQNIVFVSHLGDIVQNGVSVDDQWENASKCMGKLDGIVPYGVLPGNHDVDEGDGPTSESTKYNSVFPVSRFSIFSWYKGNYKENQNSYQTITKNGISLLFLNLEVDPTDDDIDWANKVLSENQDKQVVLTTHAYQYDDIAERSQEPYFREGGNSGEAIWNELVNQNCNIFLVLSGHFHTGDGENKIESINKCGKNVYQIIQNYQGRINGGNGLLRIYTFFPRRKQIRVQTYSTLSEEYEEDADSQFTLSI